MLDDRELGTVLAALRYWQRSVLPDSREEDDIATNGWAFAPLNDAEIDNLCERLNLGEDSVR